jgi:hypothetical protein
MNDLVFMLTATLQLPIGSSANGFDSNELTDSSNDSDKTVIANGYPPSKLEYVILRKILFLNI